MISICIKKKPNGNVRVSMEGPGIQMPPTPMSGEQLEAIARVMLATNHTWSAGHSVTIEIPTPGGK